jgi:hypothetical protein
VRPGLRRWAQPLTCSILYIITINACICTCTLLMNGTSCQCHILLLSTFGSSRSLVNSTFIAGKVGRIGVQRFNSRSGAC